MSKDKTSTTAKKSRFKRTTVPDPQALVSAFLPEARAKFLPKARAKQAKSGRK